MQYYTSFELDASGKPYGFFSHGYDGVNGTPKSLAYIMDHEDANFKLYFSEQITDVQANRLMLFMIDGGFLDFQTDTVIVELITLNSNLNMFAIFTFTFTWQVVSYSIFTLFMTKV